MAKLEYRSLAALKSDIQYAINHALADEVADAVRNYEMQAIQDVVYNAYEPKRYERRYDEGGLADPSPDNMRAYVSNGTLYVDNLATFNEDYDSYNSGVGLAELVEYGDGGGGYHYEYPGKEFREPRPFTQETINRLRTDRAHVETLKLALKARGLNVK